MRPLEVLDAAQVALLLSLAGIEIAEASPLRRVEACPPSGDAADRLRRRGLLLDEAGSARTNVLFRTVLEAAAQPEEVLTLRVTGAGAPEFSVCRRGALWTECTVAADGTTKFEFPLSREAMIITAGAALSSDRPEVAPAGFRFRGRAADGMVLVAIAAAGRGGVAYGEAASYILDYATVHPGAGIIAALADPAGVRPLLDYEAGGAIARLRDAGHLDDRAGCLVASRKALAVLGVPADAGFVASRTVTDEAHVKTTAVQVWRAGDRSLLTRAVTLDDGTPGVEWMDLQKAELRAFVAAVFADAAALAAVGDA